MLDIPKANTNTPNKIIKIVYITSALYDEPSSCFIFAIRINMIDVAIQAIKTMIVPIKNFHHLPSYLSNSQYSQRYLPRYIPSLYINYGYM